MSNLVPEGWAETKVSDVCHTIYRYPTFYGMDTFESGVPVIRGEHIKGNGKLSDQWSDYYFVCSKFSSKYPKTQLLEGDVVMAVRGTVGKFAKVGKCHQMSQISPNLIRLAPERSVIEQDFFFHNLFPVKDSLLKDCVSATGVPALNGKDIAEARMLLPPLPEQKKIAAILTSVDDVIEKTQAQIDKLKDLKTGMMQELLTRGVGVDGKPHTEFKDSPVGLIPKGWKVKPIIHVLEKVIDYRGKSPPKSDSGVPLLTAKNIRKGFINPEPKEFIPVEKFDDWMVRGIPTNGDVFITTEAPLGNVARVPKYKFAIGQRVLALCPKRDLLNSDFLLFAMQSDNFAKQLELQSTGSTVAGIKQSTFKNILLPVPTLDEQKLISACLKSAVKKCETLEVKLTKLNAIKKALMQDLLTGKVRVKVDS